MTTQHPSAAPRNSRGDADVNGMVPAVGTGPLNLGRVCNDALTRVYASINGRIDRELLKARQQAEFNRRSFGQWLRFKGK